MNHRLFHTLVLSGVALVEGCASVPPPPAAAPTQTAQTTSPTTAAEPAPTTTAEPAQAAAPVAASPSADEVRAILADGRACSPGWPTTKGASLTPPRPVALNGRTYGCITRPERGTQCCLQEPAR